MTELLEAALDWVDNGWSVFPCLPDKKPATEHGFHDATQERGQVERWFGSNEGRLVAVPTVGYLVVDLDYRPDLGINGWQPWLSIAVPGGWDVEDAPLVETPSGGLHIWYRQPEALGLRNTASALAQGIDTRADGGYVIVPPSRTPAGAYAFINGVKDVPEIPPWMLTALQRTAPSGPAPSPVPSAMAPALTNSEAAARYGLRALEGELGRLAQAPEGQRNDQLNRSSYAVGQLVGAGVVELYHAAEQMLAVATRIGLPDKEASATIRSGLDSGMKHPRSIR